MDIVGLSMNPIRGYSSLTTTERLGQSNLSRQERDPTYFYFFLSRPGSKFIPETVEGMVLVC